VAITVLTEEELDHLIDLVQRIVDADEPRVSRRLSPGSPHPRT
jgi:hypothetical protein